MTKDRELERITSLEQIIKAQHVIIRSNNSTPIFITDEDFLQLKLL